MSGEEIRLRCAELALRLLPSPDMADVMGFAEQLEAWVRLAPGFALLDSSEPDGS